MLLNIPPWFVGIIGKPPPLGGLPNPHGAVCCGGIGAGVSGCVGVIPSLSLKTEDQIEFPRVVCVVGVVGVVVPTGGGGNCGLSDGPSGTVWLPGNIPPG